MLHTEIENYAETGREGDFVVKLVYTSIAYNYSYSEMVCSRATAQTTLHGR